MEAITAAALKAGAEGSAIAKESARGFLSAVLRAPSEALGSFLADPINERRHANLIKIATRAKKRLDAAEVSPKAVPLSIIHPALDAASLEEDPDLQEIWANLLANAADPRADNIHPSFVAMLKQMSSKEVKFLNALFEAALDQTKGPRARYASAIAVNFQYRDVYELFRKAGLARFVWKEGMNQVDLEAAREDRDADERDAVMCMDSLQRQELVIETIDMDKEERYIKGSAQGISYTLPRDEFRLVYRYTFSQLGIAFVTACRPPEVNE